MEMETVQCSECNTKFGVGKDFLDRMRQTGDVFHCPKGHRQVFRPSENDNLKAKVKNLEGQIKALEEWANDLEVRLRLFRRQRDSYKGHFNRLKKEVNEIEDKLLVASNFDENAAEVKAVLRQFECFDMKMFEDIGGYGAYSQLLNMVIQYNRYIHRIEDLERQAIRTREYYEQRAKNQTVS